MAKKKKNPKKPAQRWKMYNIQGDKVVRSNISCPKCGQGSYMARHKNRHTCGKCNYVEFVKA